MAEESHEARRRGLTDEAAAWLVALDAGTADQEAFERWRAADPRNAVAFAEVAGTWVQLDQLRPLRIVEQKPAVVNRRTLFRAAASVAVVAAIGATAWPWVDEASAETGIGERRTIRLPDGAIVEMNTRTRIRWRRLGYAGRLELDDGEIAISGLGGSGVTIVAGQSIALMSGAFNIRRDGDRLNLLSLTAGAKMAGRPFDRGMAATIDADGIAPVAVEPVALDRSLAWQRGELVFAGEPLSSIIADYNRYLERPIVIGEPALARLRIGGRFASTNPQSFLDALSLGFDLDVRDDGTGPIIIMSGKKSQRQ